jgi:hypothetical protein
MIELGIGSAGKGQMHQGKSRPVGGGGHLGQGNPCLRIIRKHGKVLLELNLLLWANTVRDPWPISVRPTPTRTLPSWLT